jgi:glycolate oxidase iron-sulfur subunit
MQTSLADFIRDTLEGREADAILRKCVHCGFCTATCPTYQLLGDELDSPRGRIYLIKQVLEGNEVTAQTRLHLDRCLTCRACETTCPSGVEYGRLADIGRKVVEERVPRSGWQALQRAMLAAVLPAPRLFGGLLALGRAVRPLLPAGLKEKVPEPGAAPGRWPEPRHARRMLVLAGCVQPAIAPAINAAAARVLDRLGISLVEAPAAGCCGAVRFHLNRQAAGKDDMRAMVDTWWPHIEAGVEAIVMTASGCGSTVKEYGHLLRDDPEYAQKAARVSELTRDLSEVLGAEGASLKAALGVSAPAGKLAFHSPCSLQHGQQVRGGAEEVLAAAGFELVPVPDAHLCCGSAGTYSILQPELSRRLRANKVAALQSGGPQAIATANIGCLAHLQSGTATPVVHWVELLDRRLGEPPTVSQDITKKV